MSVLSVRDLRTYFHTDDGEARAVDGVSFDLADGEILALVGESGCGKSVTSLSILGLIASPPGEIIAGSSVQLGGRELLDLTEDEMRHVRGGQIAMIFQEPMTSLNPVMRVGEQVAEAIRAHSDDPEGAVRKRVLELLGRVGIPDPDSRYNAYPHQLSGGMRQRVMIAMALSSKPAVLIADEPTTALDVTIQAQVLELLRGLRDELGMAILFVTHDLGVVAEIADRVAVMYAGRIVEESPVADLFRRPRHPYTEGLLRAVPDPQAPGRLMSIPGAVPSPLERLPGCTFAPRCPHVWPKCRDAEPPSIADGQTAVRCWLAEEPERRHDT
ncbi:MAG: ABC transporter ATP-binding protein [Gemmatimonadota bacterium]